MATTTPNLGYGDVSSADLNTVNTWMRSQPWYQQLLTSFGQDPNHVNLNDDEKQAVIKAAQANGIVVNEGGNGQTVDDSGNFEAKSHLGRNILIGAGIAAAIALPFILPAVLPAVGAADADAFGMAAGPTLEEAGLGAAETAPTLAETAATGLGTAAETAATTAPSLAETASTLGEAVDSAGNVVPGSTLSSLAGPSDLPAAATASMPTETLPLQASSFPGASMPSASLPSTTGAQSLSAPGVWDSSGNFIGNGTYNYGISGDGTSSLLGNLTKGGVVPGALVQGLFQNAGSKRQAQAATDALNYTKQMQAQQQAEWQPYQQVGLQALGQLSGLSRAAPGAEPAPYNVPAGYTPQPGQQGAPGGAPLSQLAAAPPQPGPAPPSMLTPPTTPTPVTGQPVPAPMPVQGQQAPSPQGAPGAPPVQGPTALQPASTPPTMNPTPLGQRPNVTMRAPDGSTQSVPAGQVAYYQSKGATVVSS